MDQRSLETLQLLARALLWAALAVLVLAFLGALQIATSDNELPLFSELQEASRGIGVLLALGGGITSAGILAGLGGILRLLLDARDRDRAG